MGTGENGDFKEGFTDRLNLINLGKGILAGYILIIPILAVFAYAISLMNFPEKYITGTVIVANIISVIVAGSISASSVKAKGWLNGATAGLVYYIILFLISSLVMRNYKYGLGALSTMITCVLAGSFGGMIGINFKRPSEHRYKRI